MKKLFFCAHFVLGVHLTHVQTFRIDTIAILLLFYMSAIIGDQDAYRLEVSTSIDISKKTKLYKSKKQTNK